MEFVDMKRYLDDLVDRFKAATKEESFPGGISAVASIAKSVLVFSGIEVMADIMNLELHEDKVSIEGFEGYEYYFMYRGVKFHHFASESERLVKNVSVQ